MDAFALRAVAQGGVVDGDRSHGIAHSTPSARRWQPASAGNRAAALPNWKSQNREKSTEFRKFFSNLIHTPAPQDATIGGLRRQAGCGKRDCMDGPPSKRPDAPEPTGIESIPHDVFLRDALGCVIKTAIVALAAVLLAVAAASWLGVSEENAFHFLHSATAWKIRLVLMGVLMVLTAHVVFCNHALMWSNSRKKTSRSLLPILGLAFGAPTCLAAPPGSIWRWVAAVITLADPGTWLTFWLIWSLLRHLAASVAWALRRRPR